MSGIVATSLITLIPFSLGKIHDGIFLKAFKGIPASFQTLNSPYLSQGIILFEENMLRDTVLMAVLKFLKIF